MSKELDFETNARFLRSLNTEEGGNRFTAQLVLEAKKLYDVLGIKKTMQMETAAALENGAAPAAQINTGRSI